MIRTAKRFAMAADISELRGSIMPFVCAGSSQPETVLRDCCRFLGVNAAYEFSDTKLRTNRGRDALAPSPLWDKLGSSRTLKAVVGTVFSKKFRQKIRTEMAIRAIGRYRLNMEEKRFIADSLRPDYQRLVDEYGVNSSEIWDI